MKIKLFLSSVTLILSITLFLSQCGKYKVIPDVCFSKNILPIFISKCTTGGCHSGGLGRDKGSSNFTTYEGIMSKVKPNHPLLSEVYTQCNGKNPAMPPSGYTPLTATELEYIKYWIHTGAKNPADCNAAACDTTNISYSTRIQPFMNTWCVGCHNSANAGGGYDLSTYAGVKSAISPNNRLMGSINQLSGYSAMPQGSAKVDACDITAIQKWVDAGYPEN